jgi:two-component system, chemotaxis family, chemotaxis protein CheY
MRILLVDDSTTMRNIQRKILAGLGHTDMAEAADGIQAFAAFNAQRPDLMLVDWNMPNMDGLTLVKKVREVDKNVLVIMVTTEAGKTHVIDAIKAGVNNYVVKPFTAAVLAEKLEQTLSKRVQMVGSS